MTRRLPAAQRREQLLDRCAQVVDVEGFHAATLERIAAEAGVTRTVLYQHFGGLDGMLDALVARASERAARTLREAGAWERRAPSEVMAAVLAAADADPATWRLLLVLPPAGPPSLTEALAAGRRELRREVVTGLVASGVAADPELAARVLQSTADELVRLRLADPSQYDHDRLLHLYRTVAGALLGSPDDTNAERLDHGPH